MGVPQASHGITQNTPYKYISINISSPFFKTNLTKCAVVWVKKRQKSRFRKTEKLQNHSNEGKGSKGEKERARRWKGEEKKSNGCTLSFIMATLDIGFWPKKLSDAKGQFGKNVIKNPARYIYMYMYTGKK